MQELWNEICFIIDRYRQTNADEKNFQIEAENIFEKLGWSRFKGQIISQQVINVGSAHTVRPDIVISNGKENLFVVELKKPSAGFSDRNADQLISYMRLLKLSCGMLLGDSIRVFYDTPNNQNDPVEIVDIPFEPNNADGAKLLDVIKRDDFTEQRLIDYCQGRLRLIDTKRNAERVVNMLCSSDGHAFIAKAVQRMIAETNSEEIADLVLADLNFSARKKESPVRPVEHSEVKGKPRNYAHLTRSAKWTRKRDWNPNEKVDALELHPREGESFQTYVRRTMEWAFSNHMLSSRDIELLQDLDYCKRTFALAYPLIVDGEDRVRDKSGNRRYWKDPVYGNYYCCSQWWRDKIPTHEKLFSKWVTDLNKRHEQNRR